jgi:L-cysteine desulfidase
MTDTADCLQKEIDAVTAAISCLKPHGAVAAGKTHPILKNVLKNEVQPAWGCTEPSAVALATCLAFSLLKREIPGIRVQDITNITLSLSASVFKNSFGVRIPYTGGMKGVKIAAALGALADDPKLKLEVLRNVTPQALEDAKRLVANDIIEVKIDGQHRGLKIQAIISGGGASVSASVEGNHTSVSEITVNGRKTEFSDHIMRTLYSDDAPEKTYRDVLREMCIRDLIAMVNEIGGEDQEYILQGVLMNLELAKVGLADQTAAAFSQVTLNAKGYVDRAVLLTSSASHARMGGANHPAMSSGGAGNQGIVAILLPYLHGSEHQIPMEVVIKSICLSHLVNSYVKCFMGELSPICGCAIGAGLGASAAIVFQRCLDRQKLAETAAAALNNLIVDLAGVLCDGAKTGCSIKVGTAAYAASKAAELALNGYSVESQSGIIGSSVEQSIKNLGRLGSEGLAESDRIVLTILNETVQ